MGVYSGVSAWTDLLPGPRAIFAAARGVAAWMEKSLPWPLDLGPRLSRLSLDVALWILPGRVEGAPGKATACSRAGRPVATEPAVAPRSRREARPSGRSGEPQTAQHRPAASCGAGIAIAAGSATAGEGDREVAARGAPLYVRDTGDGPPVLLLHAFPLNGRMWEPQLESLRARQRVIAPDLPGFGLTWTGDESATLDGYARAVVATLDRLGVADVAVVGLSMGGYLAFRLVEPLGGRLRGLVLACTRATADDAATVASRHELAAEVEAEGLGSLADAMLPRLLGKTTQIEAPEVLDHVRALVLENQVPGVVAALRAMAARPDSTPLLERIACPVMCIAGDEDVVTPAQTALAMASRLRDASVEVVPRVGHLVSLEAPAEFNTLVAGFLARTYGT